MRARIATASAAAVIGLMAGVTVGCSSSDTSTPATTSTSTTTTTAANRTVAFDTPDGQVSVSLDGKLPPNWPTAFPVAPGATPAGSGSLGNSDKTVMVGVYSVSGSAEDAFNFYKNDAGLTVTKPTSGGIASAFAGRLTLGGQYDGSVTVAGAAGAAYVVVVLKSAGVGSNGTVTTQAPPTTGGTAPGTTSGSTPSNPT